MSGSKTKPYYTRKAEESRAILAGMARQKQEFSEIIDQTRTLIEESRRIIREGD